MQHNRDTHQDRQNAVTQTDDRAMHDYHKRKRRFDDEAEECDEIGEIKRPRFAESADISKNIVSGFMDTILYNGGDATENANIVEHLAFETYWIAKKRAHYIQALVAVLGGVTDVHRVCLNNVARNLTDTWNENREFDWDQLIVMFSLAGSLFKKRPNLQAQIYEMLCYYCALNHENIKFLGGWRQCLCYTNLDLAPEP